MSARGVEFAESWIRNNVTPEDQAGDTVRATVLADRCRQAAAAAGIAEDELESEFGSLETIIYGAMVHLREPGTPGD